MSVDSSGLNTDWLSSLNDSISSDPTLSDAGSGFDYSSIDNGNDAFLDNSGTNMENAAYYAAGNSPGITNFSSGGSGVGGLAGLLASLTGRGAGGSSSLLNSILGIGSGIYGMSLANQLQGLSKNAIAASNPFGPYRAQYAGQLASLEANPSSVFSDPGYQAAFDQGSQAVARRMAGSGYAGSGNEAIALQQYGQSFANNYIGSREQQLAYLAGAGITPNPGPGLSGYGAGIDAAGNALGSLGYGASMAAAAAGGGAGHPSAAGGEAAITNDLGLAAEVGNLYDSMSGSNTFSGIGNAAGIASGIEQGGVAGYGKAALGAGQLAGKAGIYGSDSGTAAGALADVGAGLSIYQGIERGGFAGDTQAATGAAQLATNAGYLGGATGGLAKAVPYAAIPLAAYNFATQDTKSGATGSDALGGAEAGAEAGSAFGPVGTVVGAVVGAVGGAVASAFGPGEMDPENISWNNYAAAFDKNPGNVNVASPTQNYQALAGIFDARGSALPFYQKYGRMGENQFMTDMAGQINRAMQSGMISSSTSPSDIYSKVVEPWINSMSPSGWQATNTAKGAPEKGAVQNLLTNLIGEYQVGAQNQWIGVDGQQPFIGLSSFGGGPPVHTAIAAKANAPITNTRTGITRLSGTAGRLAHA